MSGTCSAAFSARRAPRTAGEPPALGGDRVEAAHQQRALGGVHHAVGQLQIAHRAPPYFERL